MSFTVELEFLTVAEAARVWRVSPVTVYRKVAAGSIPAIRVGGGDGPIRIPASAVETSPAHVGDGPVERTRTPESGGQSSRARLAGQKGAA